MHKLLIWSFLFMTGISYSQYNLTGSILDANSEEPIIGATVYLQEPEKGGISDVNGNFSINNIPSGNYTLVVSSLGYGTRTQKVSIPSEEPLTVLLSPTAIEMEEVIVSTPFHQLQSDNVMKVDRATMEEINRTGTLTLAEGISNLAGVETISTGTGIGKPVIRGLSSNRVLVYTQGVRLENQQFGDEHGLGLSSSGTESIEVIKGPASLLYGSDALGGVLYLNPERYAAEEDTEVDAKINYYSNTQGLEANAGFKTSGENLKFLVRGNYAVHSDYLTGNGDRVTNTRFNEFDLKSGIGYRTSGYKGDLRYNLNSGEAGIPEEIGLQSTSKEIMEPYQKIQNHILSLDNNFYFSNSSLDLKLGYVFNNRKEFEGEHEEDHEGETEEEHEAHEEGEAALEMELSTINYDVKYHFPEAANFETILGVQGMVQENRNLGEEILIPDATTVDLGIMATTHYHLEKIDFQAGLRYDHRDLKTSEMGSLGEPDYIADLERNFDSYNASLGVKLDVAKNLTARLNFASGFRAPNLAELTSNGVHHGANRYEIGNPDLENEQNYQLDLALEFGNEHVEVFTNGFYNHINNYIYLEPTGNFQDEAPVFNYIQNNAILYGGEAGVHFHPHPLDWLHFENSFELVIGEKEDGRNLPLIPAPSLLNTLRIELPKMDFAENGFFSISLKSFFDQNRTDEFETSTPGYSLLNMGLGGEFKLSSTVIGLKLTGTNLLNETYIAHLSRLKPEGIPNMGRNISVSAEITF